MFGPELSCRDRRTWDLLNTSNTQLSNDSWEQLTLLNWEVRLNEQGEAVWYMVATSPIHSTAQSILNGREEVHVFVS
jgi:hypothetical protein